MSEEYHPDNEFYTGRQREPTTCGKKPDSNGYWICHSCGSMWSEMLSGLGWIPLSCPGRKSSTPSQESRDA